jgi:hypothetical protein
MKTVSSLRDIAGRHPVIVFPLNTEDAALISRRLLPVFTAYISNSVSETMFRIDSNGIWEKVGDGPILNTLAAKYPALLQPYTVSAVKKQPPPFFLSTPDSVKFVRDVYPAVDLVLFLPAKSLYIGMQQPFNLRRGIWSSVEELSDAVVSVLAIASPKITERIMVLPAHNDMPPIACLNFVTGQCYAFADVTGSPRPISDTENARILKYCGLLESGNLEDVVHVLKRTVKSGLETGALAHDAFRQYETIKDLFGILQVINGLVTAQYDLDSCVVAPSAAEPHPWLKRVTFADVCRILYEMDSAPEIKYGGAAKPSPPIVWYVYGRYDPAALNAKYLGKGLRPCPHTVGAVDILKTAGQTYIVTEVASAVDGDVPPEKPEGHKTVPVVFKRVGDGPLVFVGGRDSLQTIFP